MLLLALALQTAAPLPTDGFDRLKTYVGRWHGKTSDGRAIDIRYRLISNGGALVE